MKLSVLIFTLIFGALSLFSQTEMIIDARPVSIGYCASADKDCLDFTDLTKGDVSGYLLRIKVKNKETLNLSLYRNGELIEEVIKSGIQKGKFSKSEVAFTCSGLQKNLLFHNPNGIDRDCSLSIEISLKKKSGKILFFYPEESRTYIYRINLL